MVEGDKFPSPPYEQTADVCIAASLGTATFPFAGVDVAQVVDEFTRGITRARGQSGFDLAEDVLRNCHESGITKIRDLVSLERRGDVAALDAILRTEVATAVVAISFPPRTRRPHSVCLSYDGGAFVMHDSNGGIATRGPSVVSVLEKSNGRSGEVIVIRPRK